MVQVKHLPDAPSVPTPPLTNTIPKTETIASRYVES